MICRSYPPVRASLARDPCRSGFIRDLLFRGSKPGRGAVYPLSGDTHDGIQQALLCLRQNRTCLIACARLRAHPCGAYLAAVQAANIPGWPYATSRPGRMFSGIWNAPHTRRFPTPANAGSYRCPGRGVVTPWSGAYEARRSSDERHRDVPARERPRKGGIRRHGRVKNPEATGREQGSLLQGWQPGSGAQVGEVVAGRLVLTFNAAVGVALP